MNITFCGGAQTVTGSQHLLTVNGKKILLECGLFQGRRKDTYEINQNFRFDPPDIDVMLLSHAHIDHSGNIPNLVKQGFTGSIFTTAASVDLCNIMLRDSAHIQEKDAEFVSKIHARKNRPPVKPLYTIDEAEDSIRHFVGLQYDKAFEVVPGVRATFRDAGHILGSSGIELDINENGRKFRVGFSGDIGRKQMPIIRDPNLMRELDVLLMETTYGDRLHSKVEDAEEELAILVREVVARGGKIIIPAFAVGRTQLLVYILHKLFNENRIPNIPIFVDSPLACSATEVFRSHPECFDRETYRIFLRNDVDPFGFGRLTYTRETDQYKALNSLQDPHIIISASGMAEAGRILHHLKNNIENPNHLVLFVGYAAPETLARKLMDGEKKVRIFGEEYDVRCQIRKMDYFSAHADRDELITYLGLLPPKRLQTVFLVHGDAEQALPFKARLESRGYRNVHFPPPGENFTI
jgi:metallo-beta-lactamase family protein